MRYNKTKEISHYKKVKRKAEKFLINNFKSM